MSSVKYALKTKMPVNTKMQRAKSVRGFGLALLAAGLLCTLPTIGQAADAKPSTPAIPAAAIPALPRQVAQLPAGDTDKTLAALHDELERSRARLVLPGQDKPYYIEYRLLDLDERTISAQFGTILGSTTTRNRFMSVDVRIGNSKLDSSNFISDQGFRGFLGSTGTVGIDHDYDSLRQDLWLATDQAYKQALDALSHKRAFLRSLANAPTIDDFSQEPPLVQVDPLAQPDWTSRNWEAEAKTVSAVLRTYPELYNSRVTYHLIYATTYLMSTEGSEIRVTHSLAAIEASLGSRADDGTPMHDYLALYGQRPADLPSAEVVKPQLDRVGRELVALRGAPTVQDYDGPMLFEPLASGSLLAQVLGPSIGGARAPLSMNSRFDQMMQSLGGRSEWSGRVGQRVLPADVNVVDDPTAQEFKGQPLIGAYTNDQEGIRAQKVTLVENGMLRQLLMSRRPGPDFERSNGHGRSTFLAEPRPMPSNLFFTAGDAQSPADLRKKFLDACKQNGQTWGLIIREMDNPVIGSSSQDELSDALAVLATGAPKGDRMPLLVYRVNINDGHEELVRGAILSGINARSMRALLGVGNDNAVFSYAQSQDAEIAGTALGAFGSAEGGVPSTVVAPSLLFEEVEVRGPHGEPRSMPLVPPPPLQ
jgi:TldD protein